MPVPRFQIGEERVLRRPLSSLGGAEVPPGTRVRVLDREEVLGARAATYMYRVRVIDNDEDLHDLMDLNNQLSLTHKKLKDHTREVPV